MAWERSVKGQADTVPFAMNKVYAYYGLEIEFAFHLFNPHRSVMTCSYRFSIQN